LFWQVVSFLTLSSAKLFDKHKIPRTGDLIMSKMFYNYDNNIDLDLSSCKPMKLPQLQPLQSASSASLLCNVKGEIYGIEARHGMPITLYFHLDELHGWPLFDFVQNSEVSFRLLSNHKTVLSKTFPGNEIFTTAGDLVIDLSQEDMLLLKQESYKIELKLIQATGFYTIFSEADGLLVVR
jgi:hypothetical protein